jgi:cytochrome c
MHRFVIAVSALALTACSPPAGNAPKADVSVPDSATTPAPALQGRTKQEIAALIAALPAPYNAGDYENGRRLFAQCRACHVVAAGGPNRVGPHLHGMFGRKAGAVEDFRGYSEALKASDIVWDEARLDLWVADPRAVVPGNNMVFPGVARAEDRRDLVAYLRVEASD